MRWRGAMLAILVGLSGWLTCGCYAGHFFAWLVAPRHPQQTVKAEYPLEAECLVIIPYAGTDILFNDPTAPVEVSRDFISAIIQNLGQRVKTIVHPVQVARWQESNLEWPNMSLVDIGRTFKADTVLYVELEQYTMFEERSANLFRGRVRAHVRVVKTAAEHNPVYETTVETLFPEDRPVGVLETSERVIRAGTNATFARDVVRKFYDHKVEVKGGRP